MRQEQNSTLPQNLRNKFFSIRSRSQSKLGKLQSLRSSRNSNYLSNDKQWSTQKLKYRTPILSQLSKPQIIQNSLAQKQVFNLQMVQQSIKLQQLLKKLHTSFIHNKIPQFYVYYFYKRLKELKEQVSIIDTVSRQINWLKQKKSHYQLIQPIIKARQGCLRQLEKSLDNLFKNQQAQESFSSFKQEIKNYRKITTLVINQIKLWKDYLNDLCERQYTQNPVFLYKGEDYFITLMNDNMFIFNSFLSTYLNFTDKNDPFILKPTVDKTKNEKYSQLFSYTEQEKNQYIVLINYLAQQRAKQLLRKVSTNDQRVKDIEKIYRSTKHSADDLKTQLMTINDMKRSRMNNFSSEKKLGDGMMKGNNVNNVDENGQKTQMFEMQRKSQAIKRIKQMVNNSSKNHGFSIINKNKIDLIKQTKKQYIQCQQQSLIEKSSNSTIFQSPLRMKLSKIEYDDDFMKIMRKKQLEVLQQAKGIKQMQWKLKKSSSLRDSGDSSRFNFTGRNGSFKTIRISDSLSKNRRLLNNEACMSQLQEIVTRYETSNNNLLETSKSRPISTTTMENNNKILSNTITKNVNNSIQKTKTLVQKNEDVMLQMRAAVLKEIQQSQANQDLYLEKKRQQHNRIQQILQNKIQNQVLKHTQKMKTKNQQQGIINNEEKYKKQLQEIQQKLKKQRNDKEIQKQLKKQFQQKLMRQVYNDLKNSNQYKQLDNQQKRILQKQQRQKRFRQIQQQQRANVMKLMIQLDQKKNKQIQQQMQRVIKQQKEKVQKLSYQNKVQLQQKMKQHAKQRLLIQLRQQKQQQFEQQKLTQIQVKLKEQKYRQQIRRKLTKQYNMEEIVQRQKKREEKEKKLKMIQQRFQQYDAIIDGRLKQSIVKDKQNNVKTQIKTHLKTLTIEQARERILQQQSPQKKAQYDDKYRKLQQSEKAKLREQFQVQLFAFMKPQNYNKKQQNSSIIVKDIQSIAGDYETLVKKQENLKQQLQSIKNVQNNLKFTTQQKIYDSDIKQFVLKKQDTENERFERFSSLACDNLKNSQTLQKNQQTLLQRSNSLLQKSQIQSNIEDQEMRIRLGMTFQQYEIYIKKKAQINKNIKIINQPKFMSKNDQMNNKKQQNNKVNDQFQLVDFSKAQQQDQLNNRGIYQSQISQTKLSYDKMIENQNQLTNQQNYIKKNSNKFNNQYNHQKDNINQHQLYKNIFQLNKNYKNSLHENKKKQKDSINKNEEIMSQSINDSHTSRQNLKKKDKFLTSGSDDSTIRIDIQSPYDQMQRNKSKYLGLHKQRHQQHLSSQKKKLIIKDKQQSFPQIQQIPTKHHHQPPFIKIRTIKSSQLQQFMKQHFQHMPKLMKRLNLYKRDELVKILHEDFNCFTILEYIENNMSLGIVVAVENRNKKGIRSFNIIHIGPYDESDTLKLLVKSSQYMFTNDPLQQLTLSIFYHIDDQQQTQFIKEFEKQIDPYGSIFQKKIFNTQYERKLIMRRMLGIKQPKKKEKVNCGCFWVQNQLIVTEKSLGIERYELEDVGRNCGSYGIVSIFLAQNLDEEKLIKILAKQNTINNNYDFTNIKHLAKQCLSFKPEIQKICAQKQFKQQSFPNALQFNLHRHNSSKPLIKCLPEYHQQPITCTQSTIKLQLQIIYPFTTQIAKFLFQDDEYSSQYFRFVNQKKTKQKTYSIKSTIYSSVLNVLPCKNSRYKMFVMSSYEYDGLVNMGSDNIGQSNIKNNNKSTGKDINLDIYLKLFFSNLSSHEISPYESIWLPQFKSKQQYQCRQIQQHFMPQSRSTLSSQLEFYYTKYIQNSLMYIPSHRDLFITPPFILGVIDSQMQLVAQGSVLVVKRIELGDLIGLKEVPNIIDED